MQQNVANSRHLLVLDPRQPGWCALLATAAEDTTVLVIDPARDGLSQLADMAAELAPLASLHLHGPGEAGILHLGSAALGPEALEARRRLLAALGRCLLPGGHVHLAGPAGAGAAGGRLLAALGRSLGRDVIGEDQGVRPVLPAKVVAFPAAAARQGTIPWVRPLPPLPAAAQR